MPLSGDATKVRASERRRADERRQVDNAETVEYITQRLANATGGRYEVQYIEKVEARELKVYRKGQFNERSVWEDRPMFVFAVDDVRIGASATSRHNAASDGIKYYLRRPCGSCPLPAFIRIDSVSDYSLGVGGKPIPEERRDERATRFAGQVGRAAEAPAVCFECRARPEVCESCGRPL